MFKNLKLKLTLINVAIVSLIFLISIIGIYFVMKKNIDNQFLHLTNIILKEAGTPPSRDNPPDNRREHLLRYFYIKIDNSGNIISYSPYVNINNPYIKKLLSQTMPNTDKENSFEWDSEPYKVIKKPSPDKQGYCLIFINTHAEYTMLEGLMWILAGVGIIGLILVFIGSMFMANKALIPIVKSWQRQKDFVADASHELRTPLSVIQTSLDIIIGKKDSTVESQLKWLENVQAENKRMSKLVTNLLFLARTDSDQVTVEKKVFPLHTVLMEAYISLEPLALKKGLHLKPFKGIEANFYGDELRIKQLIIILLDNAIKHTPSGGNICLSLGRSGEHLQIIVSDTGEGIDKEHLNKIFERFYRADKSRSRKEGSSGLGLAIAEWIVKEHHGSINVTSEKGSGTNFYINLP